MIEACRDLRDSLAHGPSDALGSEAQAHLVTCVDCRAQVAAHERFVMALRQEPEPIDDFARTRLLAKLGPQLDDIARARTSTHRSGRWRALLAVATAAAGITWWLGRTEAPQAHVAAVALERDQLRPYVVAGPRTDPAAATLLAGRFSMLVVGDNELVRAAAGDRDVRVAAVGPARIDVEAATSQHIALSTTGTLLVDARSARAIQIRTGGLEVRAINATFGVQQSSAATVIFVERGEIELGDRRLRAGAWYGPASARSAALVTALRDHELASPPPVDRDGILAIDGRARAVTEAGAVLGTGPLWARLPEGDVVVLVTTPDERRVPITIRGGMVVHVPEVEIAAVSPPTAESSLPPHSAPAARPATHEIASSVVRTDPELSTDAGPRDAADPTASELYTEAEAALRGGDRTLAAATWTRLVTQYPQSAQAASALYDLAGLARASGDRARARAYLAQIDPRSTTALREPAHYLSCRLAVESNDATTATTCFTSFRAAFPRSSHDDEVLAWLAGHAEETGGCSAARALFEEYVRRYPHGSLAARAHACERAR